MERGHKKKLVLCITLLIALLIPNCAISETKKQATKRTSTPKKNGIYHVVEKGQTLWRIAKAYGVELIEIVKINNLSSATRIGIGQKIFIPGAIAPLKVDVYQPPQITIFKPLLGEKSDEDIKSEETFTWPVEGKIISQFGKRRNRLHNGIDIRAQKGDPIHAAYSGIICFSGWGGRGYGRLIIIEHENSLRTYYAHNLNNLVEKGEYVEKGQMIALVGRSGRASNYHLHFEVRNSNKPINPLHFLLAIEQPGLPSNEETNKRKER